MYIENGLLAIIPSVFVMFFYRTPLSQKHISIFKTEEYKRVFHKIKKIYISLI